MSISDKINDIIGIKEYASLCTNMVPFGIGGEHYSSVGYIISPITISQWESFGHLEINDFITHICSGEEFLNLVNHVYNYQIEKCKYSEEEIKKNYEKIVRDIYVSNKKN